MTVRRRDRRDEGDADYGQAKIALFAAGSGGEPAVVPRDAGG